MANYIEILIVDDCSSDILLLERLLDIRAGKIRYASVSSGSDAIEYLERIGPYADAARPLCVLLDLVMPQTDGFDVLRHIKNSPHLRNIPVIILSSSDRMDDIEKAYAMGANAYVQKPSTIENMLSFISSLSSFWLEKVKFCSNEGGGFQVSGILNSKV